GLPANSWYIHDLAIKQSFAGRQIGQQTYEYVCKMARKLKLTRTHLVAVQGASKFWQKFGYNQWHNAPEELSMRVNSYGSAAILMHNAL
ncbi:MAG: GNAT family N-acetyltransferase, partial [Victivallaceae bacterium]